MTLRSLFVLFAAGLLLGSCGGDDDGGEGEGEGEGEEGEGESTLAFCTDDFDNDVDGHVDCFDQDCLPFQSDCAPPAFYEELGELSDFSCLHDNPPDPPPGGDVDVRFYAEDFQEEDPVEGVTIEVFFANRIAGEPDLTLGPTDDQGRTEEVTVPAGTLIAVRTLAIQDEVRLTVEFDVRTPEESGDEVRALSVSDQTYRVVPATVGVVVDPGKGIVAGQFSDCSDHEVAGLIAEVEGQDPDIRYFVDRMPSREPVVTTEDGLYVAINVEPGDHELVLMGRLEEGGEIVEVGRREIQVLADSINVVDLGPLAE
ncbi:MAG: hypothetical protein HYY06_07200 [Deltaproteobacteria bacterium]|nr:hypothetical protein [Deltaproteobacteria bacterium]